MERFFKFAAVPGAVAYAVLFVAYRRYYTIVGIDPESAGVNNSYVVSRALGFLLLAGIFIALVAISRDLESRREESGVRQHASTLIEIALFVVLTVTLIYLNWGGIPIALIIAQVILAPAIFSPEAYKWLGKGASTIRVLAPPSIGIVLIAASLNTYAYKQATFRALEGCSVSPLEVYGIPVLDVAATRASITWIGTKEQRPASFASSPGVTTTPAMILSHGSTVSYLRLDPAQHIVLVELPGNLVAVESDPRDKTGLVPDSACRSK